MTTLEPKRGLEIYLNHMKIEETLRDCKDLLHLTKLMNKKQTLLEHMIALCLLAYISGVWLGEAFRDVMYGKLDISQLSDALLNKQPIDTNAHPKWLLYSGLFILLKQKLRLSRKQIEAFSPAAASAFAALIYGNVRSFAEPQPLLLTGASGSVIMQAITCLHKLSNENRRIYL